jgi:hypothetical protein
MGKRYTDAALRANNDVIDHRQSKSVATYAEAAEHVASAYWVDPIQVEDESDNQNFHQYYRAADFAQNGKVHYERRK